MVYAREIREQAAAVLSGGIGFSNIAAVIMLDMRTRRRALALAAMALAVVAGGAALVKHWRGAAHRPAAPRPSVELEVHVLTPQRNPAPGATLTLIIHEKRRETRTESSGTARFLALESAQALLSVSAPGAARAASIVQLRPGTNRVTLTLQPAVALEGQVLDDVGGPVEGAELEARPDSGAALELHTRTDEQGRFHFVDAAPGSYALAAQAEHHDLAVLPGVQAPTAEPVRIVVQRSSSLRGQVLDAQGKPAPGSHVTIAGSGIWPPKTVESDASGRFELNRIPGGIYELRATRGTWTSAPREGLVLQPASEASVSLLLEPGATLAGQVIDAQSGAVLRGVKVTVVEDGLTSAPVTVDTGQDGEFRAEGLRRLPHRLWIRPPGYVAVAGEPRLAGEAAHEIFALRRAGVLAGQVLDERDAPVADVELEVNGTNEQGTPMVVVPPVTESELAQLPLGRVAARLPSEDNLGVTFGSVPKVPLLALPDLAGGAALSAAFRSDKQGRFRIEGVPAGQAQVIGRHAGFAFGRTEPRSLHPGELVEGLKLVLPRGGTVHGRVLDARGFPVSGVRIQLEVPGEPAPRLVLSAGDGGFQIDSVRGKCTLTAYPTDGPPVRQLAELESGQTRELVLQLSGESHELTGRVHDARGFPVARVKVTVEATDPRSPAKRSATTAQDGMFRVEGLPSPPYRVLAEHPDYAPSVLASVSPEKQNGISIEMQPGARVFGIVVDGLSNNGIGGAAVRLSGGAGRDQTTRSNARGQFEFRLITIGKYEIYVNHVQHMPAHAKIVVADVQARELDPLVMQPTGEISGQVVDQLGAPVFDAEIAVGNPPAWNNAARSDHLGRFRLGGVAPGEAWLSSRLVKAGTSAEPVPVRVFPRQESPGLVLRLR